MIKLIKKIFLLVIFMCVLILILVGFDCFVIGGQYKLNYQASLIDKVELLKSIDEPKIILVGNSNLAFGMYSDKIEETIGMPVVNLGLHGGLGNAYHEEIAKLNINAGDIVVVCHSNFADDDTISEPKLAWVTYDYNNDLWPIIREKDYISMLKAYPGYLRDSYFLWITRSGNKDSGTVYSRSSFNKYGDVVEKSTDEQMDADAFFKKCNVTMPSINDTCINRLNAFNRYCEDRGALLVVAGFPIAYGKYSEYEKSDFQKFQSELDSKLDCEIISDYIDYFFPYHYFFNTEFHLNEEGANVRTNLLIDDLENLIKTNMG